MLTFVRFSSSLSNSVRRVGRTRKTRLPIPETGKDPGINTRLKSLRRENIAIDDGVVEEVMEERTIDPYNLHKVHKSYEIEEKEHHDKLVSDIVKRKYFPDIQLPNLLTWSEKEHIRFLHNQDPKEWTAEKIADSFPITVNVAKKLVKLTWKPATQTRIDRHDASVIRNWKELKEGTLPIDPALRETFLKFSNRIIPPRKEQDIKATWELSRPEQVFGEYSSIVAPKKVEISGTSPQSMKQLEEKQLSTDHFNEKEFINAYYENKDKRITLSDLKSKLTNALETGHSLDPVDEMIVKSKPIESTDIKAETKEISIPKETNLSVNPEPASQVTIFGDMSNVEEHIEEKPYHLRIRIPKKLFQRGKTYKINDCYYDDDGKFLFRVPGMNGKFVDY